MNQLAKNRGMWYPTGEFSRLQNEINRLFDFDYPGGMSGLFDRHVSPAIDVVEKSDEIVVYCDLPGIKKEDVDLSIAGSVLTIKGEKKKETDKGKSYRDETWSGSFQRTISLPEIVDPNKVDASMKDGVLSISLAKMEDKKPKQIEVKVK
jgi:HSP20 family protein